MANIDFLENNLCGQNILQIVSNGNATIAELLRLKNYIPDVYKLESKEDQTKYGDIILDFSYFKVSEVHEQKIESNDELQELDEEFRDNYIGLLNRFYLAFESIHQYITNLKHFIDELNDGVYIQQSLESVLQNGEGKQLVCESLYLYGIMLLIVDFHIPSIIRERLLVSYHRYSVQNTHGDSNIDDVCKLLRSTGFVNERNAKPTANYPEDYFRRIDIDQTFIEMVIGRLRSDDIYNQISIYPLPEHRTTALANQAGMLYVCLFFSPATLQNQTSTMREIVDKFFSDSWIISIYMGITINLSSSWEPYKAAKAALANNTVNTANVHAVSVKHSLQLNKLLVKLKNILKEGALTEQTLTKNITKMLTLIRECNVTLRWMMLHTSTFVKDVISKKYKHTHEQVLTDTNYKKIELFELLLNTSQLELKVRDYLKVILNEKETRWNEYKKEASIRIIEVSNVFGGEKLLTKMEKNDDLKAWFLEINKQIENLDANDVNIAGQKIILLIQALEGVQEFHNLDSNMQVKQCLTETCQYLHQMITTINIKEEMLINLQLIGDLSYAWHIIDEFTDIMQESVKKSPNLVIKLRATFLKLSSALEIPLLRINQSKSEDLISVSQYYSNELVNYVRKVIQIIPRTMFEILAKIVEKQTSDIKEVPTRLEKDKLKEYAQMDERFIVAKLTYSISVFTEGILMMQKTLVGVIELDPKQLLEDGIRKELVQHVSNALHKGLTFNLKSKNPNELESNLQDLGKVIDGYRRSFEYVQDYLNIHGLKIWQEEMSRIINYNVEKECNNFLRDKVLDFLSVYQNTAIPIPNYQPTDTLSINFIGRLAREILRITDPKTTIYLDLNASWFDYKTHKSIINQQFFPKITESIGIAGLIGLDELYSFMIVTDIKKLLTTIQKVIVSDKVMCGFMECASNELQLSTIAYPGKFYSTHLSRFSKVMPKFLDWILKIGQKQILRQHIAYELNISCKFNSKNLESSLRTFNDSLLIEFNSHSIDASRNPPSTPLLAELNKYLEPAGLYNPLHKIYIITKCSRYYALIMFMFVLTYLPKLQYSNNVSCLLARKLSDGIDGNPLIVGILTIFKQCHKDVMITFIDYLCQYALSFVDSNFSAKQDLSIEAQMALLFLEQFTKYAQLSRDVLQKTIPDVILNQYEFLSHK